MLAFSGVLSSELRGIRRCSLVRVSIALLEEVCHWGVGFGVSKAEAGTRVSPFLLFLDSDVELLAPSPAPCLPACYRASHHDDNGLNF